MSLVTDVVCKPHESDPRRFGSNAYFHTFLPDPRKYAGNGNIPRLYAYNPRRRVFRKRLEAELLPEPAELGDRLVAPAEEQSVWISPERLDSVGSTSGR